MQEPRFLVYQFFPTYVDRRTKKTSSNVWIVVGSATQEQDAQETRSMIIARGFPENFVVVLPDSASAPTVIPIAKVTTSAKSGKSGGK